MVFEPIIALPEVGELDCNQARRVLGWIELAVFMAVRRSWRRGRLERWGGFVSGQLGSVVHHEKFSIELPLRLVSQLFLQMLDSFDETLVRPIFEALRVSGHDTGLRVEGCGTLQFIRNWSIFDGCYEFA